MASERLAAEHQQMLDDRPERESREVSQQPDDDDDADQQADEQGAMRRKRSGRRRSARLAASPPASAMIGTLRKKRPANTAMPVEVLNQGVFAVRPPNAEPLSEAVAA
jgi:hypothetical protein